MSIESPAPESQSEWAVVVGATGALGEPIVRRLAAEGLHVLAVGRGAAALDDLEARVSGVSTVVADIGHDDSVALIADALPGPVRMLVQGAALPFSGPTATVAASALGEAVGIKAGGLLRLVRAAEGRFTPSGRVVAIGGIFGPEPVTYASAAGVANAALANLVRQLADVLGPQDVTVHLISPGAVETERLRRMAADAAQVRGVSSDSVMAEYRSASPIGRLATPEQIAWAIGLLLAPEADAFTGSGFSLDVGARHGTP
jgi:NAD(P)-dependent dehydrogenase (short-subunit alcohol dehydrogenase family)